MGIQNGSQQPYSLKACHAFFLSETWDEGGFPMLLLFWKHRNHNRQNFYSNCLLAKKNQWNIIGIHSVISENISSIYLKSFALLSIYYKQFYLAIWLRLSYHFHLDLGPCHCSEFSAFSRSIKICLFFYIAFFTWIVHKFLNNLFYTLNCNISK